ncbi:MAG: transposase family protein [bacterium]|nr:transposase family protein [bacterium]
MLAILLKVLPLPSRKMLLNPGVDAIVIDVTEQPLERPVKKQRRFYSGKKTRHTIKAQLIMHLTSRQILSVVCGKGRTHDFTLFTQSQFRILSDLEKYADSGYQGLDKCYVNSFTPIKKPKGRDVTSCEKAYNRA